MILELRAEDRIGLLSRLAAAFADCGANVRWAKIVTMGAAVVDAFCLELGGPDEQARRAALTDAVLRVVPQPAPKPPEETPA
ncbi:(protein-PII) uridylyltransferase [Mycobacteroides abscessus subsp. abscessus]|nr:(protein-PII) uridylyltransferase [Mycobacteroides abscessus subsp. abscessus]